MFHKLITCLAGPDRSGIVHEVAGILLKLSCNVEESRMTSLGSDFAVIMMCSVPETVSTRDLKQRISDQLPGPFGFFQHCVHL